MPPSTPAVSDGRACPLCGTVVAVFGPGPGGKRLDACCPTCGSLERHRFLALVASGLARAPEGAAGTLLDVAPMAATSDLLRSLAPAGYLSIDFDPAADRRQVDVAASLTHLPLPGSSVSLVVCLHVLEHVPDDAAAMREIARVLTPGGLAVLQVPRRSGVPTDEDPSVVDAAERLSRFGQADHVRYYGDDFEDRLRAAGLTVSQVTPGELLDETTVRLLGLISGEVSWLCHRAPASGESPVVPDPVAAMRAALPGGLAAVLERAVTRVLDTPGSTPVNDAKAPPKRPPTVAWARRQPPVRWAARVTRPLRTRLHAR